jgi:hypothetical protein
MQHEKILTTIAGANLTSRLEVALCLDSQGSRTVELRRLSWGDGVGWYCQQTLRLDPREAENLLWALKGGRRKWRDQPSGRQGKIIAFPLQRTNQRSQSPPQLYNAQKKQTSSPSLALPVVGKRKSRQQEKPSVTSHA